MPEDPFDDLTVANIAARAWCAEVNAVMHSDICAIPAGRAEGCVSDTAAGPIVLPGQGHIARGTMGGKPDLAGVLLPWRTV